MSEMAMELEMQTPQDLYASLMAARRGDPVEDILARILATWSFGKGGMPEWLGLGMAGFHALMQRHFPGFSAAQLGTTCRPFDMQRADEMADLRKLLMENRTSHSEQEALMAEIVIAGSMGEDHLWQDLGLWNRSELTKLMNDYFQPLAQRNDKDMKWKKFLYKQLCETEGIYTCRSPSCEVCADYLHCFGPEE